MSIVIVTGTGTDVGKTIATAALASAAKSKGKEVVVVKPAQTGFPDERGGDLDTVAALTGCANVVGYARYPEPMAPIAAAERAGMELLTLESVAESIADLDSLGRVVFVEGAGGLLVRLGGPVLGGPREGEWALPDLAKHLPGAQTVIVTSMGLGSLNTAELTVEVARTRGMDVAGLIAGSVPGNLVGVDAAIYDTNLRDMAELTGAPFLASVPHGSGALNRVDFTAAAPGWLTRLGRDWLADL